MSQDSRISDSANLTDIVRVTNFCTVLYCIVRLQGHLTQIKRKKQKNVGAS